MCTFKRFKSEFHALKCDLYTLKSKGWMHLRIVKNCDKK